MVVGSVTIAQHIGWAACAGIGARLVTVLIPVAIARTYGINAETDAFFLAAALILFWTTSLTTALEAGIVALLIRLPADQRWGLIIRLGRLFMVAAVGLGVVLVVLSLGVGPTLFPRRLIAESTILFIELSPLLILSVWNALFAGWLNTMRRFGLTAGSPILVGSAVLLAIWGFADTLGIHALVVGYLAGELLRAGVLFIAITPSSPFRRTSRSLVALAPALRTTGYQWIGVVFLGLNPLVDRLLAADFAPASVSTLELIERIYQLPIGVINWAVLSVLTTHWAGHPLYEGGRISDVRGFVWLLFGVGVLLALFLTLFHQPLLPWLFTSSKVTAWPAVGSAAFLALIWGLPFQLTTAALWRAAVARLRSGRLLMLIGASGFGINLIGDLMVRDTWELPGITFVTAATALVTSITLALVTQSLGRIRHAV